MSSEMVHKTHCCLIHGCCYGDKDCPVENGKIEQEYICESCDHDGIKSVEEIKNPSSIPLKIKFISTNDGVPEHISILNDDRNFLFVSGGMVYAGYYHEGDVFKTESGERIIAEAWIQWEEIS